MRATLNVPTGVETVMSRPLSELFAVTHITCTLCGAARGQNCRNKFGRPFYRGVHAARRSASAELRRNNKEMYRKFKELSLRKSA